MDALRATASWKARSSDRQLVGLMTSLALHQPSIRRCADRSGHRGGSPASCSDHPIRTLGDHPVRVAVCMPTSIPLTREGYLGQTGAPVEERRRSSGRGPRRRKLLSSAAAPVSLGKIDWCILCSSFHPNRNFAWHPPAIPIGQTICFV